MALLALQSLKQNNIKLPTCAWIVSPWVNPIGILTMGSKYNEYDSVINMNVGKKMVNMSIGNIDINGNDTGNKYTGKESFISPLFGEFKGLCLLYYTVGGTEIVLNETIQAAKLGYDNGVETRVDIEPYLFHGWPLFVNTVPEAKYSICKAANYFIEKSKQYRFRKEIWFNIYLS